MPLLLVCLIPVSVIMLLIGIFIGRKQNKEMSAGPKAEEQIKVEESFEKSEDNPDLINIGKISFLTSLSHEIRTPINAVIGFNEMISRESDDENIREYTGNIDRAARHLLNMINNMLDMEQLTAGNIIINPDYYDLTEVLRDAYMINAPKAEEKGLEFKLLSAPEIPRFLYGDNERLRQIIIQLVSNAIKYTAKGSVRLEADYYPKDAHHIDLIIHVFDTGIGIKEEDKATLFDVFERFDRDVNNYASGAGIGLSVTKGLVELMGGTITLKSEYGKGSCFTVSIPQTVSDFESMGMNVSEVTKARKKYVPSFAAPYALVLVVDDNEMNLKVAEGLLAPLKINTERATSGYEMLDMIAKNHYDAVLLDHLMPRMDGIVALRRMRADKTHPNQDTPVIVMTANAIRGMREKFLAEGFTDYLPKPIEPGALEEMMKRYLPEKYIEEIDTVPILEKTGDDEITLPRVSGIDLNEALKSSTGEKMVAELMRTFCRSSVTDLGELEEEYYRGVTANDAEALELYKIRIHAMKNSAALIGAMNLSVMAKELEHAAGEGNTDYLKENHELFVKEYERIVSDLSDALLGAGAGAELVMDSDAFMNNIELASRAMENYDTIELNNIMMKLSDASLPSEEMRQYVSELRDALKDFDRERFFGIIDKIWNISDN